MNIDLEKTLGHEIAKDRGVDVLRATFSKAPAGAIHKALAADLSQLMEQAVNALLNDPTKPGATLALSQLSGYLEELCRVVGLLTYGRQVESRTTAAGTVEWVVRTQPRPVAR